MVSLQGATGIAWELQRQPKPDATAGIVTNFAEAFSTKAIKCLMVGMEREALELLANSNECMTMALDRAAAGEVTEMEYMSHFCHAICRWLIGPPALAHDLTRAYQLLTNSREMTLARARVHYDKRSWVLPLWLSASRSAECVALYEQSGAKYPPPRRRQHTEAEMAYLLARERLHPTLPKPEVTEQLQAFLRDQVPTFMKYGRYDRFALWVKIATRAEAGAPARAAVREIADQYA